MNPDDGTESGSDTGRGDFQFVTRWRLEADRAHVWRVFEDGVASRDPFGWWPGVEVTARSEETVDVEARSGVGYRLRFRLYDLWAVEPDRFGLSATGDLRGRAVLTLNDDGESRSSIDIDWHVRVMRPWMRRTQPWARPVFVVAHHVAMRRGRRGLQARLNARRD